MHDVIDAENFTAKDLKKVLEKKPNVEIINLNEKLYHSGPAVSRSQLWEIKTNYRNFLYKLESTKQTDAMVFGSLVHDAVLLPENVAKFYAILPSDINKRTKQGKADFQDFIERSADKMVIKEEDLEKAELLRSKLFEHPTVSKTFSIGRPEVSYYWTDPLTGEYLRCRMDWVIDELDRAYDLKTTSSATTEDLASSIVRYGYFLQDAFYSEGYRQVTGKELSRFSFIFIEKNEPFGIRLINISQTDKNYGAEVFQELLIKLKEGKNSSWDGYPVEEETIRLRLN